MAVMKKLDRFQEYFFSCGNSYDPRKLGMNARTESETVKSNDELEDLKCQTETKSIFLIM